MGAVGVTQPPKRVSPIRVPDEYRLPGRPQDASDAALDAYRLTPALHGSRPASQLSRPNFGATLLQVAPESNNLRLALTFADSSFHLGWAELILGWLLALAMRQIKVALDASPLVPASDEVRTAASDLQQKADVLSGSDRCYIQEVDEAGFRRFLFHNFRRTAGGAGKKILL